MDLPRVHADVFRSVRAAFDQAARDELDLDLDEAEFLAWVLLPLVSRLAVDFDGILLQVPDHPELRQHGEPYLGDGVIWVTMHRGPDQLVEAVRAQLDFGQHWIT